MRRAACRSGTAAAIHMNAGKMTDVMRPIDSKPPVSSGGRVLTAVNRVNGSPNRRSVGRIESRIRSAATAWSTASDEVELGGHTFTAGACPAGALGRRVPGGIARERPGAGPGDADRSTPRGLAFYPGDRVADDRIEKSAVREH